MIILFNSKNKHKNRQKMLEISSKNSIPRDIFYAYDFEDDFSIFLNQSLTKSFEINSKKAILLKVYSSSKGDNNWDVFLKNLSNINESKNIIFLESEDSIYDIFSEVIDEKYLYEEYTKKEIRNLLKKELETRNIKYDFNMINDIANNVSDMYWLENEITKILLLNISHEDPFSLVFLKKKNIYPNLSKLFFSKKLSLLEKYYDDNISKEQIYPMLDYFISFINQLIIYKIKANGLKTTKDKSHFMISDFSTDKNVISENISLEVLFFLQEYFLDLKDLYLHSKSNDIERLIILKIISIGNQIIK